MSDDAAVGNSHTSPADDAIPDPVPTDDTVDRSTQSDDPQGQRLSEEAARWRRQARAEETNRIVAEAKVAELQRAEIDRHLATKVALPGDFWLATDVTVADLLNDDGTKVDTDKVSAAADAVLEGRDHWRAKLGPVGAPSSAVTGDGKYSVPATEQPSWEDVLKGKAG